MDIDETFCSRIREKEERIGDVARTRTMTISENWFSERMDKVCTSPLNDIIL